jgi:hypothetical protein
MWDYLERSIVCNGECYENVYEEIKFENVTWICCVGIKTDRLLAAGSNKMRGIPCIVEGLLPGSQEGELSY